jgi:hypothetical protein
MALYADITTHPPLNQITVLPSSTSFTPSPAPSSTNTHRGIPFTALLTTHINPPRHPNVVRLHYTTLPTPFPSNATPVDDPTTWPSLLLTEADADAAVTFVRTKEGREKEQRRVFQGILPVKTRGKVIRFAVAFKNDDFSGWRWEEGVGGKVMGEVLVAAPEEASPGPGELQSLLGLKQGWSVNECDGGGKGIGVFEVVSEAKIPEVKDGTKTFGEGMPEKVLGLVKGQVRAMSLIRLEPYWLGVQHSGAGFFEQTMDGVMALFLLESGATMGLLAFGGEDVYTVIRASEKGEVVVVSRNDSGEKKRFGVLAAVGEGHEAVIENLMAAARRKAERAPQMQKLLEQVEKVGKENWVGEEWQDGLTLCTWNGFDMHRCSEKAVMEGLETLDKTGVKIETFLLDDCWQSLGDRKIGGEGNEKAGW